MKVRILAAAIVAAMGLSAVAQSVSALVLVQSVTVAVPRAANCPTINETYVTQTFDPVNMTCTRNIYR